MTDSLDVINAYKKRALTAEKKLKEIENLAGNLYYHSITDPVKREATIDKIRLLAKMQGVEDENISTR